VPRHIIRKNSQYSMCTYMTTTLIMLKKHLRYVKDVKRKCS